MSTLDDLSEQVRRFLTDHISSVAQLEILLLLQTNPQQSWEAPQIARELRIEPAGALRELLLLAASHLVQEETAGSARRFRYAPATPDLQAAVLAVAQAYLLRRVTVIGAIFAKPADSIRAFADAFKLRKDPPHAP